MSTAERTVTSAYLPPLISFHPTPQLLVEEKPNSSALHGILSTPSASSATHSGSSPVFHIDQFNLLFRRQQMPSREELAQVKEGYLALWDGDLSNAATVLAPDVKLHIDRHPAAGGSAPVVVNSSEEFLAFIKSARAGWESLGFKVLHWAADGRNMAIRWKAEAIMGKDYGGPTTLKAGDAVTWNGTDFLVLNSRNLIEEVNIAQDMMELFHALGITSVSL